MNTISRKLIRPRQAALLLALVFSLVCAANVSMAAPPANDRVVIQKRKITIVRTGKLARDFPERRRATINMPVISGLKPLALLNKVRAQLTLKNIFDTSLAEYKQNAWLEELDFTVNYNQNYILDITFMQTGTGAYPDTQFKHLVINLKTGDVVKAKDVFNPSTSSALTALVDAKLQAELKQLVKDGQVFDGMNAEERQHIQELYNGLKFEAANLNDFQVSDKGLTFLYDAGFPHVVQALEPDGKYFFSYAELAQHIKAGSLLSSLIR